MSQSTRTWLAVVGLVGTCLVMNLLLLGKVFEHAPKPGYVDRVTRAEGRFDAVRSELPPTGRVGYAMKIRNPQMLDWYQHYGLIFAQYSLAPLQVEPDNGHQLVLEDHDDRIRLVRRGAP